MKHVIEIDCEKEDCGKCTYWDYKARNLMGLYVRDYRCNLFDRPIGMDERKRCSDCVKLVHNLNKMPELDGGDI